jgi:hypothetical protein
MGTIGKQLAEVARWSFHSTIRGQAYRRKVAIEVLPSDKMEPLSLRYSWCQDVFHDINTAGR